MRSSHSQKRSEPAAHFCRGPGGPGGNEHGGSPWFQRGVEPGRAPAGEGREPIGCVKRAMTHRSASRCVFATHPTCSRPTPHALRSLGPPSLPRAEPVPKLLTRQEVNMLRHATFSGSGRNLASLVFGVSCCKISFCVCFSLELSWAAILAITAYRDRSCAVWRYVACSRQSRHFEPFSGRFTPIRPTNPRCERKGYALLGTRSTWVLHRPPGHCSPASRPTPPSVGTSGVKL